MASCALSSCLRKAEAAVSAGGGMQAVIEATGLRTRENVLAVIDPAILERAHQSDAAPPLAAESR